MMFPDCRNDDYYNESFLDGTDKEFIRGYDWATEEVIDNFFDNNFNGEPPIEEDGELSVMLSKELPDYLKSEYEVTFTFGNRKSEIRKVNTYADLLRSKLLDWLEMDRDELITSMLDNMDEDLYNAIRTKILTETKSDDKQFYDTRKFMVTGKKETDNETNNLINS